MMGAQLSNNSWGGGQYHSALAEALALAADAGHLAVAAAGNTGTDIDSDPHYPASYSSEALISVAASDDSDRLAGFSNYGLSGVDVVAPGEAIYSTLPGDSYGSRSGTSMAAPHVTGIAALLLAADPQLQPEEIRDLLIESSDPVAALAARSASGGRVNAAAALEAAGRSTSPDASLMPRNKGWPVGRCLSITTTTAAASPTSPWCIPMPTGSIVFPGSTAAPCIW